MGLFKILHYFQLHICAITPIIFFHKLLSTLHPSKSVDNFKFNILVNR